MEQTLKGSCLCGAVTYRVDPPFSRFVHCHCSRCRKATGTAYATNLFARPEAFAWLSGEDQVARYDLPTAKRFATTFCKACGSPLPRRSRDGQFVVVPAGSLDTALPLAPSARIYWDSRAAWDHTGEDLPTFPEHLTERP